MNPEISVVIPTCNRKDILHKCMDALSRQSIEPHRYEIILVDDGSTDGTEQSIDEIKGRLRCSFKYIRQKNKGPAAARNAGIRNTVAETVLIIGDDIIADTGLLLSHLNSHQKYPEENYAILGNVTWAKNLKATPFMYWLEYGGCQSKLSEFKHEQKVEWRYFYTGNVSLKKVFLMKGDLFDEALPYATYEDSELGYRLVKRGLVIVHDKNALAYHDHWIPLREHCRKAYYTGRTQYILVKKFSQENMEISPFSNGLWNKAYKSLPVKAFNLLAIFLINAKLFSFLEKILNFAVKLSGKSWLYIIPLEIFRDRGFLDEKYKKKVKKI